VSGRVELSSVLACDDVRTESNGKLILVGVYNTVIYVPALPAPMRLNFILQIKALEVGDAPFELRLRLGQGVLAEMNGQVNIHVADTSGLVPLGPLIVEIPTAGTLAIDRRVGRRWKQVQGWQVELQEAQPPVLRVVQQED